MTQPQARKQTHTSELMKEGEEKQYFRLEDEEAKQKVFYLGTRNGDKGCRYSNPEEKVRLATYLRLIIDYGYSPKDIALEVTMPARTPDYRADIVLYEKGKDKPYLIVECKKDGITDAEYAQAIEQGFGNAISYLTPYIWVAAGNTEGFFEVDRDNPGEREKTKIADIPKQYGKIAQYRFAKGGRYTDQDGKEQKAAELEIGNKEDLIAALKKCHDTVWEGGRRNPSDAFDEVTKLLFCKISDEKDTPKGTPYRFQIVAHEDAKKLSARIFEIYEGARKKDPKVFERGIDLEPAILRQVVEHLQKFNINTIDLDSKGVAFEKFMGDFFKGKMGQYFTPRQVVEFVVSMLDIQEDDRVIDPCCGSGGFLLYSMDQVRKQAEKDHEGPEAFRRWHDFASRRLFGIEVNEQIARVCKMNMIVHDDGHTHVISHDALDRIEELGRKEQEFKEGNFDKLATNPPFGAMIKASEKSYLKDYELSFKKPSQRTEVLFLEQYLRLLREGGRAGVVLPDGLLSNSTMQSVRSWMAERVQLDAVVSLPSIAFSHYGAGVKCSLIFFTNSAPKDDHPVFMAEAKDIGYDATGRDSEAVRKGEPHDLDRILEAYQAFQKSNRGRS